MLQGGAGANLYHLKNGGPGSLVTFGSQFGAPALPYKFTFRDPPKTIALPSNPCDVCFNRFIIWHTRLPSPYFLVVSPATLHASSDDKPMKPRRCAFKAYIPAEIKTRLRSKIGAVPILPITNHFRLVGVTPLELPFGAFDCFVYVCLPGTLKENMSLYQAFSACFRCFI